MVVVVMLIVGLMLSVHPSVVRNSTEGAGSTASLRDAACNSAQWQTTHLALWASSCQATFGLAYAQNVSDWNTSHMDNFTFFVSWIAEFTPEGQIVRAASPLTPAAGVTNITFAGQGINVATWMLLNVSNASGNWTVNDTGWGSGPSWNVSGNTAWYAQAGIIFHLENSSANSTVGGVQNPSLSAEFDLTVIHWPWFSSEDRLGIELDSLGDPGTHFSFNNSTHSISEGWDQNNATFVTLILGGQANVTYSTGVSLPSPVDEQVGLFDVGTPDRAATSLLTFEGPQGYPGGYERVIYDPWILFSPSTVPSHSVAPSAGGSSWAVVLLGFTGWAAAMAGIVVRVARNEQLHREGTALLTEMRATVEPPSTAPKQLR